ncbi:HAD-like domain [Pseudocohnilembus persalinus]|uniref:HAD-like domain n=1 Tax=Pseudocohnilembus persalinus TaxID=266149 RepID=A0A0V0QCP2_PSEPJ|nr:HAD-like domain [Pseudocohnilembus persalinus]|eukprot:KRW99895.1 HAD-like domain [Pseudocohnilembus persalinus]
MFKKDKAQNIENNYDISQIYIQQNYQQQKQYKQRRILEEIQVSDYFSSVDDWCYIFFAVIFGVPALIISFILYWLVKKFATQIIYPLDDLAIQILNIQSETNDISILENYKETFLNRIFQLSFALYQQALMEKNEVITQVLWNEVIDHLKIFQHIIDFNKEQNLMPQTRLIMAQIFLTRAYIELFQIQKKSNIEAFFHLQKISHSQIFSQIEKAEDLINNYEETYNEDIYTDGDDDDPSILRDRLIICKALFLKYIGRYKKSCEIFADCLILGKKYEPQVRQECLLNIREIITQQGLIQEAPFINKMIEENDDNNTNKDIVFCIDFSQSMEGQRKNMAVDNFCEIFNEYVEDDDRIGFIRFNHNIDVIFELQQKKHNTEYLYQSIENSKLVPAQGETAFLNALYESIKLFQKTDKNNNSKWIVALTDGDDNISNISPYLQQFLQYAVKNFNVVIFTSAEQDYADTILNKLEDQLQICLPQRFYKNDMKIQKMLFDEFYQKLQFLSQKFKLEKYEEKLVSSIQSNKNINQSDNEINYNNERNKTIINFNNQNQSQSQNSQFKKDQNSNKSEYFIQEKMQQKTCIYQVKDLNDIFKGQKDLSKVIFVDDFLENFINQPNNGYLIQPYNEENKFHDQELKKLIYFLQHIIENQPIDVRPLISNRQSIIQQKIQMKQDRLQNIQLFEQNQSQGNNIASIQNKSIQNECCQCKVQKDQTICVNNNIIQCRDVQQNNQNQVQYRNNIKQNQYIQQENNIQSQLSLQKNQNNQSQIKNILKISKSEEKYRQSEQNLSLQDEFEEINNNNYSNLKISSSKFPVYEQNFILDSEQIQIDSPTFSTPSTSSNESEQSYKISKKIFEFNTFSECKNDNTNSNEYKSLNQIRLNIQNSVQASLFQLQNQQVTSNGSQINQSPVNKSPLKNNYKSLEVNNQNKPKKIKSQKQLKQSSKKSEYLQQYKIQNQQNSLSPNQTTSIQQQQKYLLLNHIQHQLNCSQTQNQKPNIETQIQNYNQAQKQSINSPSNQICANSQNINQIPFQHKSTTNIQNYNNYNNNITNSEPANSQNASEIIRNKQQEKQRVKFNSIHQDQQQEFQINTVFENLSQPLIINKQDSKKLGDEYSNIYDLQQQLENNNITKKICLENQICQSYFDFDSNQNSFQNNSNYNFNKSQLTEDNSLLNNKNISSTNIIQDCQLKQKHQNLKIQSKKFPNSLKLRSYDSNYTQNTTVLDSLSTLASINCESINNQSKYQNFKNQSQDKNQQHNQYNTQEKNKQHYKTKDYFFSNDFQEEDDNNDKKNINNYFNIQNKLEFNNDEMQFEDEKTEEQFQIFKQKIKQIQSKLVS